MSRTESGSFCIIDSHVPVPGVDFPQSDDELTAMIPTEQAARRYVEMLRFPRGFVCRRCGDSAPPWRSGTGLLACTACREPTRIVEGTLFDGSTVGLRKWLRLLWEATRAEAGVTSAKAQEILGMDQLSDASEALQRVRVAMGSSATGMLRGDVRLAISRVDVAGAAATVGLVMGEDPGGRIRVRLRSMASVSSRDVVRLAVDHIEEGSRVHTNAWRGFKGLVRGGYRHLASGSLVVDGELARVLGLLKLWLWSNADAKACDLQPCLDDFAFRYNRREYGAGLLFYRLMILAVTARPPTLAASREAG